MNPMVRNYLEQIQGVIADLEEAAAEQKTAFAKEREKREELLQRYWRRQKEITVLDQGRQEFETLAAENEHLKRTQEALREHLQKLQEYTKALSSELRQ